jgi:hypothetical protein
LTPRDGFLDLNPGRYLVKREGRHVRILLRSATIDMSANSASPRPSSDYGLAPLTSPVDPQLDIVFVHGLDGSRCETWTNARNELWPSWLGEMVPNVRVWTYGYNSALWKKPSRDVLEVHCKQFLDHCNRAGVGGSDRVKVVMVGHSLGGILIKAVSSILTPNIVSSADYRWLELDPSLHFSRYVQLGVSAPSCSQRGLPGHAPPGFRMGESPLLFSAWKMETLQLGCPSSETEPNIVHIRRDV